MKKIKLNESQLNKIVKRVLQESYNEDELNKLLDKISKTGIGSLSFLERKKLDNIQNPDFDAKQDLIDEIKLLVERYGGAISMSDMEAPSSPAFKEIDQEIHLIERLYKFGVEVVVYGGYKYQDELNDYNVKYEELTEDMLLEIKSLIDDAIDNELLEEDI